VEIVHSDMLSPLPEQIVLLLPPLFGHVAQLVQVKFESLFQNLFQFSLVRSGGFSRLVRDRLEQTQDHLIVRDRFGCIGFWRIGRGARTKTLHFGREA
jgi:hypothetical protein